MDKYKPYIIDTWKDKAYKGLFGNIFHQCLHCKCQLFDIFGGLCHNCSSTAYTNNGNICLKCGSSNVTEEHYCDNCNSAKRYFNKARSYYVYEGEVVRDIIKSYKYAGNKQYCQPFSYLLAYLVDKYSMEYDIVCSVPLSEGSLRDRGFNQAQLLAMALCDVSQRRVYRDVLVKVKDTPKQESLPRSQRLVNVKGAYAVVDKQAVKGMRVLLVDDVMTTGSTLSECSAVLMRAGALEVNCVTVASAKTDVAMEGNYDR